MNTLPGYEVIASLYLSSRSSIYRAKRLSDGLPVILKQLAHDQATTRQREQFRQEYELLHKLQLEGVITAYDLDMQLSHPTMVLEDFGGVTLNKIEGLINFSLAEKLQLAVQITSCIAQLHDQNIIHKDINPANIAWNRAQHRVKLIDLGLATELSREVPETRQPDRLEGTLTYLSPEQTGRMNRAIDYRSDFYSLGATLYELMTGQLPFTTKDVLELVYCHIAKQPIPADQINPKIPRVVSQIIHKLMAKTAEDRYQSAAGIIADLKRCVQTVDEHGAIPDFTLGEYDRSARLHIPQKLYGRENQVAVLLKAFDRVCTGHAEILLVAGYSGIGKSALVHEVQKPITKHRGFFIEGKFDQYKRDIPYTPFIHAFSGLIHQLLTEDTSKIEAWKNRLIQALGVNARVITDVIPDLALLIGEQPAVMDLPPAQAQNRFNHEFRKFVAVFASSNHPLVLFLDDLQWADLPSLQVMALLLQTPAIPNLLMIGAYRDNEIGAAHPLPVMLKDMAKQGAKIDFLTLVPLDSNEVNILLADTLNEDAQICAPLAQVCLAKTKGNPFFLNQFLARLYEQKLLWFSFESGIWQWDIDKIKKADITDNIVELMVDKLKELPEATQQVVHNASCLGNIFDLKTLTVICALDECEVIEALWPALHEELLVPLDDQYKYAGQQTGLNARYRFLHDRVQQAAYQLSSQAQKAAVHLSIARLWRKSLSQSEQQIQLFELVNHFNLGRDLISDVEEQKVVAELNLSAGKRAKASAAYKPALTNFQTALQLIDLCGQEVEHPFVIALYLEAAEAAYMSVDLPVMRECLTYVLEQANNILDRVKALEIQIQYDISEDKFADALKHGFEALGLLGEFFPKNPTKLHIILNLLKTKFALSRKSMTQLAQLPDMSDEHMLAASRVSRYIVTSAFYETPEYLPLVVFAELRRALKHGYAAFAPFYYAAYGGMVLCGVLKEFDQAVPYGELALQLLERPKMQANCASTLLPVHANIRIWKNSFHASLPPLRYAYLKAMEIGDNEFAANILFCLGYSIFYCGHRLEEVEKEIEGYCASVAQLRRPSLLYALKIMHQAYRNLIAGSNPTHLRGEICDESAWQYIAANPHDQLMMFILVSTQLVLSYLFGDYDGALENAILAEPYEESIAGFSIHPIVRFYGSLTRLALLRSKPIAYHKALLLHIKKSQQKLASWAKHAPMNFLNKWHLVEAELARHEGRIHEAMEHYEQAIRLATEHNFPQEAALAYELAGDYCVSRSQYVMAKTYLNLARLGYRRWGATAKEVALAHHYAQWLGNSEIEHTIPTERSLSMGGTEESSSEILDFISAIKASQTLSTEIVLERLLKRLLEIVIENAGAQRGILLLKQDQNWFLEAEKADALAEVVVMQSMRLDESNPDTVKIPLSLLRYMMHTKENIVIANAVEDKRCANDRYVQEHQLRSLLLVPILHQGDLIGLLYLENNAVAGAFLENRLEVLNLLASQAAISIENARLYADMEERVRQRTHELQEAQNKLVTTARQAGMAEIATNVLHNVGNVLNSVNVSADLLANGIRNSGSRGLTKAVELMEQHLDDLGEFITHDQRGRMLPDYLKKLAKTLQNEQSSLLNEIAQLNKGISHVKEIVSMQQSYAGGNSTVLENIKIQDVIEDALRICAGDLKRSGVEVVTDVSDLPSLPLDKHRILLILVNLISNARQAMEDMENSPPRITLQVDQPSAERLRIQVQDNGGGILSENLTRIFAHGFTTRQEGHGFGLHSCANAATEMGGTLIAQSEGIGRGANFVLELPTKAAKPKNEASRQAVQVNQY